MWKKREDEKPVNPAAGPIGSETGVAQPRSTTAPVSPSHVAFSGETAKIGKSVTIKGELSGGEDLYIDGEVQGKIDLQGQTLIVGPNGRVRANIAAKTVILHGKVDGNVHGAEKVELRSSAVLTGDVNAKRIAIEDGAFLKGKVELLREEPRTEASPPKTTTATGPVAGPTTPALSSVGTVEPKK
jgi:cytoskeletal protein CcmA (bactofilin family)